MKSIVSLTFCLIAVASVFCQSKFSDEAWQTAKHLGVAVKDFPRLTISQSTVEEMSI